MNKKCVIGVLLLSAMIAAVYFLWPSDEKRIKKLFKEGARAAESGDVDGIVAKISFNYRDDYGMTYLTLKEVLKREFGKFSEVRVEYDDLKIKLLKKEESSGDRIPSASHRAIADFNVRVIATSGGETGYIIGDIKAPHHLRFTLEKERVKWLIIKAEGFEAGA